MSELHLLMECVLHANVGVLLLLQVQQLGVDERVVLSHIHAVDGGRRKRGSSRQRGRTGGGAEVGRQRRVRMEGVGVQ